MKSSLAVTTVVLLVVAYFAHESEGRRGRPFRGAGISNVGVNPFTTGRLGVSVSNPLSSRRSGFIQFRRGRSGLVKFDVDSIKAALQRGRSSRKRRQKNFAEAKKIFRGADGFIRRNIKEQNSRSIIGAAAKNEFVDSKEASDYALEKEEFALELLERDGIELGSLFDENGEPNNDALLELDEEVGELSDQCVFEKANTDPCTNKYREATGRCTNLEEGKRTWGMAGTPYTRLLLPKYEDGFREVRKTEFHSNNTLKSPREISTKVTTTRLLLDAGGVSAQIMQWGQFVAHEFTLLGEQEEDVVCCPDTVFKEKNKGSDPSLQELESIREELRELRGDVCIPIENNNDKVFNGYICMEHSRSKPSPVHDCTLSPRQQMNLITHVFDASAVYGSSDKETRSLRGTGGKMKVQIVNNHILPPQNNDKCPATPGSKCPFKGGDGRINATPNLVAEHTIFLVLHNKIVDRLAALNRHWDGERLFQETRRIVGAIQGNIHYYEYLPIVIGNRKMNKYKLNRYDGFDADINPAILNELGGAAFRFGHSLIDGFISLIGDQGDRKLVNLTGQFFNSTNLYEGGILPCVRGLIHDKPWKTDRNFPPQMRNQLFAQRRDIVSLNLNRGRDHGFASYLDYRRHYKLSVPRDWAGLRSTHPSNVVNELKQVYTTVEDIELYIGGVTEKPFSGALIGELFAEILGDGFARTRNGDRLWFENEDSGFTPAQRRAIKVYKYNQLLCEGSDIDKVPSKGFFRVGKSVSEKKCSDLPKLNLGAWREDKSADRQKCEWKTTEFSPCCNGKRKVKKICVGESATCKCPGDPITEETCRCGRKCRFISNRRKCRRLNSRRNRWWLNQGSTTDGGAGEEGYGNQSSGEQTGGNIVLGGNRGRGRGGRGRGRTGGRAQPGRGRGSGRGRGRGRNTGRTTIPGRGRGTARGRGRNTARRRNVNQWRGRNSRRTDFWSAG